MNEKEKRELLNLFCDWIDNRYLTSKEKAVEIFLKEQKEIVSAIASTVKSAHAR